MYYAMTVQSMSTPPEWANPVNGMTAVTSRAKPSATPKAF